MDTRDAIRQSYEVGQMVLLSYVKDLSDDDLMLRPAEGCNHLAYQLGHLLSSEGSLLESICPGKSISFGADFDKHHDKENAGSNDASQFCSRDEYVEMFGKAKEATFAALATMSDEDLDQPGPEKFREMFPTVGSVFVLIASHGLMHAGQFVPVRRKLGKDIVI